jgi:tRNA(Ile)-lysidine synthetase-like protein
VAGCRPATPRRSALRSEPDILKRFRAAWSPPPDTPLTLLLSGGGDSTALFFLLKQAGHPFSCLHFQHDSPGDFAARSREFCQALCERERVPLEVVTLQACELHEQGDLSWEAAARRLRYHHLQGQQGVFLTAHTADDQAETVLMRLLDGAGLAGLAGIRSRRQDGVERPLLGLRRSLLRNYLERLDQDWLEDPSNRDGNDRARLRQQLMPLLEQFNPSLISTLGRTARTLAADEQALTELAQQWLLEHGREGDHWPLSGLRELPSALRYRVLRELWRQAVPDSRRPLGGLLRDAERLVMEAQDDRMVPLPGGCRLRKLGGWLWMEPPAEPTPWSLSLPVQLSQPLVQASWAILPPEVDPVCWLQSQPEPPQEWLRIPLPAGVFEAGKQYELRTRRPGDSFLGHSLKKQLAASGHPPWVRDRWPLLSSQGQLVAVPGLSRAPDQGAGWLLFRPSHWRWRLRGEK